MLLPGWSSVSIANHRADVFEPPGAEPRFAVLYLHPVGGELPSENAAFTAAFAKHGLAVCAPAGGQSWWTDRDCPEFDESLTAERHLLENVVLWMAERWNLNERRIAVAGVSMGGQGAVRLGFRHPQRFRVVASIAGAFDFHEWYERGTPLDSMYTSREQCRHDTAILQVDPMNVPPHIWFVCDPDDEQWYRGNDRLHEKLTAYNIPHFADLDTSRGGHTWAYFDAMAEPMTAWIAESLAAEQLRLM